MDFFNKIGKAASDTYKATAEKTGKLAKEAKLRMEMGENKSDIDNLYKQIGKKVYEKHTLGEGIDIKSELEEECTKIDVLSSEIESLLEEILLLKDRRKCENCYEEIEKTASYCPNCGAKQEPIEESEKEMESESKEEETAKEVEIIEDEVIDNTEDNK